MTPSEPCHFPIRNKLRDRLMVGQQALNLFIMVRIHIPQQGWTEAPRSGKSRGGGVRREEKIALISIEVVGKKKKQKTIKTHKNLNFLLREN